MTPVALQRESFADFIESAMPILLRHWREVAHYKDIPLEVDRMAYLRAEGSDTLRIFTARQDGALVGYAVFILMPHPHYAGSLQAHQDVFYVAPERRGVLIGRRLIRHSEAMLAAEGVQAVTHHVKLAHPTLGRLLELSGYQAIETMYSKRLDKNNRERDRQDGDEEANKARVAELHADDLAAAIAFENTLYRE